MDEEDGLGGVHIWENDEEFDDEMVAESLSELQETQAAYTLENGIWVDPSGHGPEEQAIIFRIFPPLPPPSLLEILQALPLENVHPEDCLDISASEWVSFRHAA